MFVKETSVKEYYSLVNLVFPVILFVLLKGLWLNPLPLFFYIGSLVSALFSSISFSSFSAAFFFREAMPMSLPLSTHLWASQTVRCETLSVVFSLKYVFIASLIGFIVTGSVSNVELSHQLPGLLYIFCNSRVNEMGAWSDTVLVPMWASFRMFKFLCVMNTKSIWEYLLWTVEK